MPHRSADGVAFPKITPHSLGFRGGFDDDQLAVPLFHLDRLFRWGQARMCLRLTHSIKFCSTNSADSNRDRRSLCIKHCNRIVHLAFGLALHAICFHTLTFNLSLRVVAKQSPHQPGDCLVRKKPRSVLAMTYLINISPDGVSLNVPRHL